MKFKNPLTQLLLVGSLLFFVLWFSALKKTEASLTEGAPYQGRTDHFRGLYP